MIVDIIILILFLIYIMIDIGQIKYQHKINQLIISILIDSEKQDKYKDHMNSLKKTRNR